jgi:hypothetical protein
LAGEKPAVDRAKPIARFVDENTFAVAHVDLTRIDVRPTLDLIGKLLPDVEPELRDGARQAEERLAAFREAGGRDFYTVFMLGQGLPTVPRILIAIPLYPGADAEKLRKFLPGEVVDGFLVTVEGGPQQKPDLRAIKPQPRPELAAALEAAGDAPIAAAVIPPASVRRAVEELMPQLPKEVGGGPTTILTGGLTWAAGGVRLAPGPSIRVVVQSADAQAAEAFHGKLEIGLKLIAEALEKEVGKAVPNFKQIATLLVPKVEGDRLVLVLDEKNQGIDLLLKSASIPLVEARNAARRSQSSNSLKQIGLAMHNYYDLYKSFPPRASRGPDGKPLLSWRVHILPFLERKALYEEFHLDEPWDSEHNKKLIERMPPMYRSPASHLKERGKTNYVVPVGPGTLFAGDKGPKFEDVKDGLSNTFMVLEVADDRAVTWTKPDDFPYDPKTPEKGLGGAFEGGFQALFGDGSVRFFKLPLPADELRAWFSIAGGEPAPKD